MLENEASNICSMFNIHDLTLHPMPNMLFKRVKPGSFVTSDQKFLYVFGGKNNTIERIEIKEDSFWEIVSDTLLPYEFSKSYGHAIIP